MVTPVPFLRPLSTGKLLDQATRLYRQKFLTFVGIVAVVQVPLALLQIIVTVLTMDPSTGAVYPYGLSGSLERGGLGASLATLVVNVLSFILVQGVATAALTRAIAGGWLGEPVTISGAYSKVGRSWGTMLVALILSGVVSLVLLIWCLVPCIGWVSGPGMLAFLGAVVVPLIAPVVVLENKDAGDAIRRAWDLARRRFWWLIGFVVILSVFNQLIVVGPNLLITVVLQAALSDLLSPAQQALLNTVILSITGLLLSLVYLPLQLAAITLVYFDLRVRTEGLDLELRMLEPGSGAADIGPVLSQAPPPARDSLVTRTELVHFAAIFGGAALLYITFMMVLLLLSMIVMTY